MALALLSRSIRSKIVTMYRKAILTSSRTFLALFLSSLFLVKSEYYRLVYLILCGLRVRMFLQLHYIDLKILREDHRSNG